MFKSSFCAEFFVARPADQTIRVSSVDDIILKISFCAEFLAFGAISTTSSQTLPRHHLSHNISYTPAAHDLLCCALN